MIRRVALLFLCGACCSIAGCGDGAAGPSDLSFAVDLTLPSSAPDGGLACGPASCVLSEAAICCWEASSQYCAPQEACSTGVVAVCDGPEDCGGQVCCQLGGSAASPILCEAQCSGALICHDDGDCPTDTPHCCATVAGPTGYHACSSGC